MGLSHGFQAHFVKNANYSTLTTEEKLTLFTWFFHLSPFESTALTTQDLNFSKQFLLWGQEYSKDCLDTEC